MKLDDLRDDNGQLPAFAWPGGYPVIYLSKRDDLLCADCANDPDQTDPVVAYDIHYEGPAEHCANCNAEIESAYGDPDTDEATE